MITSGYLPSIYDCCKFITPSLTLFPDLSLTYIFWGACMNSFPSAFLDVLFTGGLTGVIVVVLGKGGWC